MASSRLLPKLAVHCLAASLSCKAKEVEERDGEMGAPLSEFGPTVSHRGATVTSGTPAP